MKFVVEGKFVGKQRPRIGRYGNVYTPQKTKDYEELVRQEYIRNFGERRAKEPISIEIAAYFEVPKSWSKKKKEQAYLGFIKPTIKPDIDNITKTILDALNGVAYEDDKQVIQCAVIKWYGKKSQVVISIAECFK